MRYKKNLKLQTIFFAESKFVCIIDNKKCGSVCLQKKWSGPNESTSDRMEQKMK